MTTFRSNGYTAYPQNPVNTVGKKYKHVPFNVTVTAAAATNGDVYILGGAFTLDDRIAGIVGAIPAMAAAADMDLGFFRKDGDGNFIAIDADILWNGVSFVAAKTWNNQLHTLNASLDKNKSIGELLSLGSDQEPFGGVYLGLTFNTKTTTATSILDWDILVEEATTK